MDGPNRGLALAWAVWDFIKQHSTLDGSSTVLLLNFACEFYKKGCIGVMFFGDSLTTAFNKALDCARADEPGFDIFDRSPVTFVAYGDTSESFPHSKSYSCLLLRARYVPPRA